MLEVPALAETLDILLPKIDFLSIGTNDLTQFLFAADRAHPKLAERYDWLSPPSCASCAGSCARRSAHDVPVGVCGEMGGRTLEAMALIGIGLERLLDHPGRGRPDQGDDPLARPRARCRPRWRACSTAPPPDMRAALAGWAEQEQVCNRLKAGGWTPLSVSAFASVDNARLAPLSMPRIDYKAAGCGVPRGVLNERRPTRTSCSANAIGERLQVGPRGQGAEPRRRRRPDPDPDPPSRAYRARANGTRFPPSPTASASPALTPTRSASTAPRSAPRCASSSAAHRIRRPPRAYYEPADPARVPPQSLAIVAAVIAVLLVVGY